MKRKMKNVFSIEKKLKSLMCAVLSAVAIISAVPTTASAATDYIPRKEHSDAEVAEVCDYISSVTDKLTMMPNGWYPASYDSSSVSLTSIVNNSKEVKALKMTKYLMATPNITLEQKSEMQRCMVQWRKAYYSNKMMATYCTRWVRQMSYKVTSDSYALKRAKWAYDEVNKSLDMYAHYNTKLASTIRKWNKTRYEAWKAAVKAYRSMSYGAKVKEFGKNPQFSAEYYKKTWAEFEKRKIDPNIEWVYSVEGKMMRAAQTYYWDDCSMSPFLGGENSPANLFSRYIGNRYKVW